MSRPLRFLLGAECIAFAIALVAIWLGAHEFVGTFGSTDQPLSCGSVWGLPSTGDLNAASCEGALRARLTLVAVLLGIAGMLALGAPLMLRRPTESSTRRRVLISAALVTPILIAVLVVVMGRHLIWSVSGG